MPPKLQTAERLPLNNDPPHIREVDTSDMPRIQLYKKILAAQMALSVLKKDKVNESQDYQYASAAIVIDSVRKVLHDQRLIAIASVLSKERIVTKKTSTHPKTGEIIEKETSLVTVNLEMKIIDTETGEEIVTTIPGDGYDPTDKAPYKAITGASKYAMLALMNLAADDDPEKDGKKPGRASGSQSQSREYPSKYGSEAEPSRCGYCGKNHIIAGQMVMTSTGPEGKKLTGPKACHDQWKVGTPNQPPQNGKPYPTTKSTNDETMTKGKLANGCHEWEPQVYPKMADREAARRKTLRDNNGKATILFDQATYDTLAFYLGLLQEAAKAG
jgi:hypothetical protein